MSERISKKRLVVTALAAGFALVLGAGRAQAVDDNWGPGTPPMVPVTKVPITCNFAVPNTTNFSFDISWVNQASGQYLLADRSHGDQSTNNEGGLLSGATTGDILVIDTDNPGAGATAITPPANDPFAGVRCDANAAFGGSSAAGRNEITGPNGVFDVNGTQAWVGDAPSYFTPGQTNKATDYVTDPCDSSVRVFDLITQQQIAHIDVHGCFRTDEGAFDPVDQVALFANPSESNAVRMINPHATAVDSAPFITLISTVPSKQPAGEAIAHANSNSAVSRDMFSILAQINFNGQNGTVNADEGIEQPVYSRQTGKFYIAIPGTSTHPDGYVAVVDPRPGHIGVVQNFPLTGTGCAPNGLALGPNFELFLGCSSGGTLPGEIIIDIRTGALVGAKPIAGTSGGCDEVYYDAGSAHFGGACNGKLDIVDAHTQLFDAALTTATGAHSIAADDVNDNFWIPMFTASGGTCGTGNACVGIFAPATNDDFHEAPAP